MQILVTFLSSLQIQYLSIMSDSALNNSLKIIDSRGKGISSQGGTFMVKKREKTEVKNNNLKLNNQAVKLRLGYNTSEKEAMHLKRTIYGSF